MHLALLISTVQQREKQNYSLSRFHGQLNCFLQSHRLKIKTTISSHISSPGARFFKASITFQARKPVLCHFCILDQSFKNVENDTCNETISYRSNIIQFMSQKLFYCSKGFDLKICLRALKVTGPFEKQASGQFEQCS